MIQKIENQPHSQVLRIEPVGAAEQEHSFLNVESEQQHGQTVNTETETAVRRTAVFKEFKVELNVFTESFFVRLFFEDFVTVLALCTGCDFNTAPDKVITLRNAVFIAHMIECALFCGVIGYEEELVIVMLLYPIKS